MADLHSEDLRDRPLGELLQDLAQETAHLIREEVELAKVEIAEKGKKLGYGIGMVAVAGVALLLMLGALTATAILALAEVMDAWLAALIVTLVWLVIAFILGLVARNEFKEASPPVPEQTIETLKEDVRWARSQTRSAGR